MKQLLFYTNVAGFVAMHSATYALIFENAYAPSNPLPTNQILENWDKIIAYKDIPYTTLPMMLWRELSIKYPEIDFKLIDTHFINHHCCCPPYGSTATVIENPENGKKIIISCCDQNMYISNAEIPENHSTYVEGFSKWNLDKCVDFFPIQGVHSHPIAYTRDEHVTWLPADTEGRKYSRGLPVASYSYMAMQHIEKLYQNTDRKIPDKLFIDCKVGGTRFRDEYLKFDNRFDITFGLSIPPIQFIEKFAQYSIIMDVNAVAEVSSRTFEGLGLGCAVIRTKLLIEYHNELIPNFHYAAVDCDDLTNFPKLADAYIDKFEELKENPKLVEFYGKNGRKWYEENCTYESWLRIFRDELINLEKLV